MALSKEAVKERVAEKLERGDFFFPEDLARGIADALGIDIKDTPLAQDPAAESRTRGDVPPFSGGRPAKANAGTKETDKNLKKFDAIKAKQAEHDAGGAPQVTRAAVTGSEDEDLETEVKEEGPIYPDDDSTPDDGTGTQSPKKKTTKKRS